MRKAIKAQPEPIQAPIINGVFSPAKALLQMVEQFGDQLSPSDLRKLDSDRWYVSTLAESWASLTANLSLFISEDHHKADSGKSCIGLYSCIDQATPQVLQLVSRAFDDIDSLLRLNELVEESLFASKGESA
jgi:hypothetical protein